MTADLWMLVASVALQWALILGAATPRLLINGIPYSVGNRDTPSKEMPPWEGRLQRASNNLAENLILMAILVLVAHVAGTANATSALGAQIFFGGRVAHALLFVAGVSWLRTGAWVVSIAGLFMIASTLF